jgi:hypothetical protein
MVSPEMPVFDRNHSDVDVALQNGGKFNAVFDPACTVFNFEILYMLNSYFYVKKTAVKVMLFFENIYFFGAI